MRGATTQSTRPRSTSQPGSADQSTDYTQRLDPPAIHAQRGPRGARLHEDEEGDGGHRDDEVGDDHAGPVGAHEALEGEDAVLPPAEEDVAPHVDGAAAEELPVGEALLGARVGQASQVTQEQPKQGQRSPPACMQPSMPSLFRHMYTHTQSTHLLLGRPRDAEAPLDPVRVQHRHLSD